MENKIPVARDKLDLNLFLSTKILESFLCWSLFSLGSETKNWPQVMYQ